VLVFLIAEALGGKRDIAMPMAYLCEIVHNGTLCVDDIEDDSKMRRGNSYSLSLFSLSLFSLFIIHRDQFTKPKG
jgi:geranylgeranyl pyrophosphate synthase